MVVELSLEVRRNDLDGMDDFYSRLSFRRPLKQCEDLARANIRSNFWDSQTPGPIQEPWLPLVYPNKPWPHDPLILTGDLLLSATQEGAHGHAVIRSERETVLKTNLFYAKFQNFGTRFIPARKFMGINSATVAACKKIFVEYVKGKLLGRRAA